MRTHTHMDSCQLYPSEYDGSMPSYAYNETHHWCFGDPDWCFGNFSLPISRPLHHLSPRTPMCIGRLCYGWKLYIVWICQDWFPRHHHSIHKPVFPLNPTVCTFESTSFLEINKSLLIEIWNPHLRLSQIRWNHANIPIFPHFLLVKSHLSEHHTPNQFNGNQPPPGGHRAAGPFRIAKDLFIFHIPWNTAWFRGIPLLDYYNPQYDWIV